MDTIFPSFIGNKQLSFLIKIIINYPTETPITVSFLNHMASYLHRETTNEACLMTEDTVKYGVISSIKHLVILHE